MYYSIYTAIQACLRISHTCARLIKYLNGSNLAHSALTLTVLTYFVIQLLLVHGKVTIIFVVSVCLFVCLFVQSFSQPSSIRFGSNYDTCYMSGSSCVPQNLGAVRPLGAG